MLPLCRWVFIGGREGEFKHGARYPLRVDFFFIVIPAKAGIHSSARVEA
jgi:hypothetical protein